MKKFTSLLILCSLAFAGAALAQQPDEQTSPTTKGAEKTEKVAPPTHAEKAVKPESTHEMKSERGASKLEKAESTPKVEKSTGSEANVSGQPAVSATPKAKSEMKPGKNAHGANAMTSPSATSSKSTSTSSATPAKSAKMTATAVASATPATSATASATPAMSAAASATPATAATASASPATTASASAAPSVAASGQNAPVNKELAAKKPDPQKVQEIKQQHVNFRAEARPDRVPTVSFNASYRIEGSDRWQGQQYEAFRSYHPERHDERWYHSHYSRVELIGGGYYYMNNGYWYPAWGYSPSAQYYAYDGPIYVGHRSEPPDRVIADVQAVLQNMGYYKGEVDGLLGPLTRQALTAYQGDRGLATTAAIDEPTLDSLDMG